MRNEDERLTKREEVRGNWELGVGKYLVPGGFRMAQAAARACLE